MTHASCDSCAGTGWETRVVPYLVPRVLRCACWRESVRQDLLAHAGIPPEYQRATFDNFRSYSQNLREACDIAQAFAARYPVKKRELTDPPGLLLIGPAGVGKTHLAAAALREIIARTRSRGLFYKMRDLLRAMRDSYSPTIQTTEREIIEPVLTCDVLVLDDLGAERLTDWVADVVDLIIDTRYSAGLPVIATTNFADLPDPEDFNGLLCRVGFRTHSRLHAMCRFVTLRGADFRKVDPYAASDGVLNSLAEDRRAQAPARKFKGIPRGERPDGAGDLKYPGGRASNTR